ncbi:MAG: zinc-ribbon domain-containing protein [Clostridia bacterium]|nr:zinc-ribbon domain-containing protein [Clostridia bacterium]
MKCPVCGRENPDIRLFCMQCGELLPETAEETVQQPENAAAEETAAPQCEMPEPENQAVEDEFAPEDIPQDDTQFFRDRQRARGIIEEAWPEEIPETVSNKPASLFDEEFDVPEAQENAYARPAEDFAPRRPELTRRAPSLGRANTYIPKREENMDPDDFFAVRGQVLPEYDEEAEERPRRKSRREGEYEDEVPQSFAVRHMRGIVTLLLLALTVAIVLIWANTDAAQYTLAKVDVAWKSEAYARLAEEAYAANDLSAAGYYYSAALQRDADNYNYAVMAANSYIEGGYTAKALEALRTCIGMDPKNADLYAAMIQIQPDTAAISASDRELIRKGYELTGDSRLNIE